MRILVTGGLGFVGINIVRYLAAQAGVERVIAGDQLAYDALMARFLAPVQARIAVRSLDVTDRAAIADLMASEGITHIIHAAAITAAGRDELAQAAVTVDVNLGGAVAVFQAAVAAPDVTRVILISSSGVYGAPVQDFAAPQLEDDPLQLNNLYAITKYSAELLARRYGELSGKPMVALRLPGVYGPMERRLHSRPQPSQLLQLWESWQGGRTVRVAGPEIMRDWTYAEDIGAAVWALLTAPAWNYPVYNAGCGALASLRDVVAAFMALGLRAEWVEDATSADVAMGPNQARRPLSIDRLSGETSYRPRYDITRGIQAWQALEAEMAVT